MLSYSENRKAMKNKNTHTHRGASAAHPNTACIGAHVDVLAAHLAHSNTLPMGTHAHTSTTQIDGPYWGNVLVLGAGKTGSQVARFCLEQLGKTVSSLAVASQDFSDSQLVQELEKHGQKRLDSPEDLLHLVSAVQENSSVTGKKTFDVCITSPGIAPHSPWYTCAAQVSAEMISEVEFCWRLAPNNRWVCVTGTNGKTTTVNLIASMLTAAGYDAVVCGNSGTTLLEAVCAQTKDSILVCELSSFQLHDTKSLHAKVACLLNVGQDHVEWHLSQKAYEADKNKIFQNMDSRDLAVCVCDDSATQRMAQELKSTGVEVCSVSVEKIPQCEPRAYLYDENLICELNGRPCQLVHLNSTNKKTTARAEKRDTEVVAKDSSVQMVLQLPYILARAQELNVRGKHNMSNVLVAAAAAHKMGASFEAIAQAAKSFTALAHRNEFVGSVSGIQFVDDSKATNQDSVVKAVAAIQPGHCVLLLGGHDKGGDLQAFADYLSQTLKVAICFGEAQVRLGAALEAAGTRVLYAPHLKEAFYAAVSYAQVGDTVLLSPACSSFDEFSSYAQRGEYFCSLVHELAEGEGRADE